MKFCVRQVLAACLIFISSIAAAQEADIDDIQALREELRQMRLEYESRIADLESRLIAAEKATAKASATAELARQSKQATASESTAFETAESVALAGDSQFNPAIGVTFQAQAWAYENDPEDYFIPGFPLGGEAGPAPEGFSLAETEITMSANVDDKFTAMLTAPIVIEDGDTAVELEEAWIETLSLPAGLALKMGRFFSGIGYLNDKHFHSWDFADQPLAYQVFLGSQYIDDGLQVRWLAPVDFYLQLSGEILRGDRYPAAGASNSGLGSTTITAKTGGDIGFSNSWQFGLSWLSADADGRVSGSEEDQLIFDGDSDLFIADFVWKWAPNGNSKEQNLLFQAEYLWRNEKGFYTLPDGAGGPWDQDQQGWYAQGIWQPFPRWRFGARIDRFRGDDPGQAWAGTPLYPLSGNPARFSLMVDWSNSEFSRLRFQYNLDKAGLEDDNQFGLQYVFSIGAHGAHSF
jgi:hypothetical protein